MPNLALTEMNRITVHSIYKPLPFLARCDIVERGVAKWGALNVRVQVLQDAMATTECCVARSGFVV